MIEKKTTSIDGVNYEFMPLMATKAREELIRLSQSLGPSCAESLDGLKDARFDASMLDDDTESFDLISKIISPLAGSLSGLVRGLSQNIKVDHYNHLCNTFLEKVSRETEDGKMQSLTKNVREVLFATSLLTELKVLVWCLSAQYSDFFEVFGKLKGFTETIPAMMASRFGSQKASIGGSSESLHQKDTRIL